MNRDKVVIIVRKNNQDIDVEVPLNISANDLIRGLNEAFDLKIDTMDVKQCFLKAERPFALLRGNRLLSDFGVRPGTIINVTCDN